MKIKMKISAVMQILPMTFQIYSNHLRESVLFRDTSLLKDKINSKFNPEDGSGSGGFLRIHNH